MSEPVQDLGSAAPATAKKYVYPVQLDGQDAPAILLRAVGHNKKVLEIGCASGTQSRIMREHNCQITGIEIDPEAANEASRYCTRVIVGNIETLDFDATLGDERFDVITIADVLEHLKNPARVLDVAKRFLSSDGSIIASIPNIAYGGLILELSKGRFDYRPYGLLDDTHIRFFTIKSVAALFERCGLSIVKLERARRPIERSEFAVSRMLSAEEESVLAFIRANNSEHDTYQFIVTARPAQAVAMRSEELSLIEQVQELKTKDQVLSRHIRRLEGELAWTRTHPFRTFLGSLWRLVSPNART